MAEPDDPLADLDIDVCNVRPAFEASLAAGISEAELESRLGWSRELLSTDGATVSGTSTYEHMEWMADRPNFAAFVLDTVARHTPASLGVVGLACKTAAFMGEAMARHGRYQALTNRTARYDPRLEGEMLCIEETRFGPPTRGSVLVSDYTILVAVQLLRGLLESEFTVTAIRSRRTQLRPEERAAWEGFAGAPIETGHAEAALVVPASVAAQPVPSHDTELSSYFAKILERAAPDSVDASWAERVRRTIERRLSDGTPTAASVARELGVGDRTLARRLGEESETFGELLGSIRRERARTLLADPRVSQAEVAFMLGYRDQASFHRAFRRWFGTTPAVFRRGLSAGS